MTKPRHLPLLASLLLGAVPLLLATVAHAADTPAGLERERSAEHMERRDELMGAQLEYAAAFEAVVEAAANQGEADAELWARAEFLLEKTAAIASRSGNTQDLLALIERLRKRENPPPPALLNRAAWLEATARLRLDQPDAARTAADRLGLIRSWVVLGPLDDERRRSFDTESPLEALPLDLTRPARGKKSRVSWRAHASRDPLGTLDFGALMQPNTESLAYALCLVTAEAETPAALRLGSDEGIAAWVNGVEVARTDANRVAGVDQTHASIILRKGENVLLLKCAQSTGPWRLRARLSAPDGSPLEGVRAHAPEPAAQAELSAPPVGDPGMAEPPAIDTGGVGTLVRAIVDGTAGDRAAYYLGVLLLQQECFGPDDPQPRDYLDAATEVEPNNPVVWLALAEANRHDGGTIPDREENARRSAILRARQVGDQEVAATVELARYYLHSMNNPSRAHSLVSKALEDNPLSPQARVLANEIYERRGWLAFAADHVAQLVKKHPTHPAALLRSALLAGRVATAAEESELFAAVLQVNALSDEALRGYVRASVDAGDSEAAAAALRNRLQLQPYDVESLMQLAGQLRAQGDAKAALALLDQRIADCPQDPAARVLRGHCFDALQQPQAAQAEWQQALALQPTQPVLREFLQLRDILPREAERASLQQLLPALPTSTHAEGASHLYRIREEQVRLNTDGTRSTRHRFVAEVRTGEGANHLRHTRVFYNPLIESVRVLDARVLHASGETGEAEVRSARYGDRGMNRITFPRLGPGDVVEVRYAIDRFRADFFGDYYGNIHIFGSEAPIALDRYTILAPPVRALHSHSTGGAPKVQTTEEAEPGRTRMQWQMQDLPAIEDEPDMPPDREVAPAVHVSTFRDWDAMAIWYWHLIEPQNRITPGIRDQLDNLTRGRQDDSERVRVVFNWVAHQIRNVAWSFGVHGYKPYSANTIFTRRFGDCKDKATMINVMARELGLEAWPVLLFATDPSERVAGRGEEDLTLPILRHFNHCISLVRVDGKDVFLDPTITYRDVEGIHFTSSGAKAVVVTPEGARRVTLPKQTGAENAWDETLRLNVNDSGSAALESQLEGTGNVALYLRAYFGRPFARNEVMRRVASRHYSEAIGAQATLTQDGLGPDRVGLGAIVRLRDYARREGEQVRLRVPPAWLRGTPGDNGAIPADLGHYARYSMREHDVVLPMAFRVKRDIAISWPAEWTLTNQLEDARIELPFGRLIVTHEQVGSTLTMHYELAIDQPRIPVEHYADFRRLCTTADRIDATELIMETP